MTGYVYDPRDYTAPNTPDPFENVLLFIETHDDYEPPLPDEDDWQGPEDDDELTECQHRHPSSRCKNCVETYG